MPTEASAPAGPACPVCGESGVPVIFGMPTYETYERSQRGGFKIGGCVVRSSDPVWSCSQDHSWEGDDRALWSEVLAAADRAGAEGD